MRGQERQHRQFISPFDRKLSRSAKTHLRARDGGNRFGWMCRDAQPGQIQQQLRAAVDLGGGQQTAPVAQFSQLVLQQGGA